MNTVGAFTQPVFHVIVALVAALVLVAAGWWLYARAQLSTRRRRVLMLLRLAAAVVLVTLLFRPALVLTEVRRRSATFFVLMDRSRSMTVADAAGGRSRWQAMQEAIERSADELEELARLLDVRVVYFDREAYLKETPEERPNGQETALGDALRQVLQEAGSRIAAVLLLSDGANNAGDVPPAQAAELYRNVSVPVFTVAFGRSGVAAIAQDVGLRSIDAGPTVFERTRVPVVSELAVVGFPGSTVRVDLEFDGQRVASQTVRVPDTPFRSRVELHAQAERAGEMKVTLTAEPLEAGATESITSNNTISSWVTVLAGGIRVLIIDGSPETWEGTFLKRSLDRAQEIQAILVKALDANQLAAELNQLPLDDLDVILLRDVPADWVPRSFQEAVAERVRQGMGLGMLGGRRSFGPGHWHAAPLAELLPVEMHPSDPQIEEPLKLEPTAEGLVHFVLRVGPEEGGTRALWREMPPLRGGSMIGEPKVGARLLATGNGQVPLLVSQEFGAGRTLAFGGDTTWQWHLYSDAGKQVHRRFWRQLVLWLARREDVGSARAWLNLATRRVRVGESLEITAGAEDERGRFVSDGQYEVVVVDPDGKEHQVRMYYQGDRMRGVFWETKKAGDYTVKLTVRQGDELLAGPVERKFLAFQQDLELVNPAADPELLAEIAELSGGEFVLPEELPAFLRKLKKRDFRLELRKRTVVRLWDNWPVLLLFVGLLVVEWTLRKRWGLP